MKNLAIQDDYEYYRREELFMKEQYLQKDLERIGYSIDIFSMWLDDPEMQEYLIDRADIIEEHIAELNKIKEQINE